MSFQLSDGTEILGLSLKGPPPLGRIYFEFTRQVTALYGLNGAGKSRLLQAIYGALSGYLFPDGHQKLETKSEPTKHAGPVLFARLPNPTVSRDIREYPTDFAGGLCDCIVRHLRSTFAELIEISHFSDVLEPIETPSVPASLFEEPSPTDVVRWLATFDADAIDSSGPIRRAIVEEISAQGLFALTACGWRGSPRWQISVAAKPGDDTPSLSAWVSKCRDALKKFKESQEQWPPRDSQDRVQLDAESIKNFQAVYSELRNELPWGIPPTLTEEVWDEESVPHWLPLSFDSKSGFLTDEIWLPDAISEDRSIRGDGTADEDDLHPDITHGLVMAKARGEPLFEVHDGDVQIGKSVRDLLSAKSERASRILASLLLGAPKLECEISGPDTWFLRSPFLPQWKAVDAPSGKRVGLSELSRAQLRWASVAIRLAQRAPFSGIMKGDESADSILLVDEPEEALHVLAERHLVRGLEQVGSDMGASTIVATHSREFLNAPNFRVVHVFRSPEGETKASELTAEDRTTLKASQLGLTEADLLQYFRVFLVVEGDHDEAVLQVLIGDDLKKAATKILKLRGSWSLRYPSFDILFDFSSARFVVALDNVSEGISRAWEKAERVHRSDPNKARKILMPFAKDKVLPIKLLAEFGIKAVERERGSRLVIRGFTKRDIIEFLPVKSFVPKALSWDELYQEWESVLASTTQRLEFKDWLRQSKGASISTGKLAAVARELDEVPFEIVSLLHVCQRAAGQAEGGKGI